VGHERGVGERREVDPRHAVGVGVDQVARDAQRQPGLADAAGAGQRHQPLRREQPRDRGDLALPPDEAGQGRGEWWRPRPPAPRRAVAAGIPRVRRRGRLRTGLVRRAPARPQERHDRLERPGVLVEVHAPPDRERRPHGRDVQRLDVAQVQQPVQPPALRSGRRAGRGSQPLDRVDERPPERLAPVRVAADRARPRAGGQRVGLQVHHVVEVRQGVAHQAPEVRPRARRPRRAPLGRTVPLRRRRAHRPTDCVCHRASPRARPRDRGRGRTGPRRTGRPVRLGRAPERRSRCL
jgi:hypothetical protein